MIKTNITDIDFKIEDFINFALHDYLKYEGEIPDIIVAYNNNTLNMFSTPDLQLDGLLMKTKMGTYNLFVRKDTLSLIEILSHECVHLWQYINNRLSANEAMTEYTWEDGKTYTNDTNYHNRPWEQEAFKYGPKIRVAWNKKVREEKKAARKAEKEAKKAAKQAKKDAKKILFI